VQDGADDGCQGGGGGGGEGGGDGGGGGEGGEGGDGGANFTFHHLDTAQRRDRTQGKVLNWIKP
jgi:hypothetical protein